MIKVDLYDGDREGSTIQHHEITGEIAEIMVKESVPSDPALHSLRRPSKCARERFSIGIVTQYYLRSTTMSI